VMRRPWIARPGAAPYAPAMATVNG
jgi:hypothetical protein